MKKIILSIMAVAALAACSKTDISYEQTEEIGFQVVSGKMTKVAVQGTTYPDLNMYVFAMTATETKDAQGNVTSTTPNNTANFLNNAEFTKKSDKDLWGGTPNPYYWPNIEKLYFAGVSKSGNVNASTNGVTPTYANGVITVDGYVQDPANANNDLMWFPTTSTAYGKGADYVDVDMLHACSWLTIKLEGDTYTAENYKVTNIWIDGLTTKGKAELGTSANWTLQNSGQTFDVLTNTGDGVALPKAGKATAENFENTPNNTIVIPNQVPGELYIKYKFKTQANVELEETVKGSLKFKDNEEWQPGVHYTYTVKITANEILIQPDLTEWTPSPEDGSYGVTVQ